MTATRNCPACGSPLPADAPAGLCPRCLMAGGFATAASPSTVDFDPPTVAELSPLFPQLEIVELLGVGGMGAVYKARQPGLDRLVALKVLPPRDDPAFTERFTREARTLAKLNHPGIVQVFDFGQAGGHSYIVMEYVEGVNLRQAERAGTMSPVEALAVVPQICAALQFAHEAGVVHRDIKPENVLLDAKGRVKIADFGLAKLLGAAGPQRLTGTHQAMGTLHYMAPEQWEKPAAVDHRADIYSLGVVFYELLTGELPLGRFAPPSEKVQIDVRLDQVVLRALEKEPERRYQHAGDVKTDLEIIATKATPPTRPDKEPPSPRRRANDMFGRGGRGMRRVTVWVLSVAGVFGLLLAFTFEASKGPYGPEFRMGCPDSWVIWESLPNGGHHSEVSFLRWSFLILVGSIYALYYAVQLNRRKSADAERLDEPPPLLAGPPGFFRLVGLPVFVLITLWLIALWAELSGQGWHQTHKPVPGANYSEYVRTGLGHAVQIVLYGVGFLGPVVAVVLLIRWLWLTMQPRNSTRFYVIATLLILFTVFVSCCVGGWVLYQMAGARGGLDHSDSQRDRPGESIDPEHEQIIGTWAGDNGERVIFRRDHTFEETNMVRVPDVKPADLHDPPHPDKARWVDRPVKVSGQYQWVGADRIEVKVAGKPALKIKVVVTRDELAILDADGGVKRLKRAP